MEKEKKGRRLVSFFDTFFGGFADICNGKFLRGGRIERKRTLFFSLPIPFLLEGGKKRKKEEKKKKKKNTYI